MRGAGAPLAANVLPSRLETRLSGLFERGSNSAASCAHGVDLRACLEGDDVTTVGWAQVRVGSGRAGMPAVLLVALRCSLSPCTTPPSSGRDHCGGAHAWHLSVGRPASTRARPKTTDAGRSPPSRPSSGSTPMPMTTGHITRKVRVLPPIAGTRQCSRTAPGPDAIRRHTAFFNAPARCDGSWRFEQSTTSFSGARTVATDEEPCVG